ncbi:MAG: AAA family ATPase, partial [Syntrophales bacterium]
YRLPESQLDRFLMRLSLGYPDRAAELAIVQTHGNNLAMSELQAVVTTDEVMALIDAVRTVHLAPALQGYMVDLAEASRRHPALLTKRPCPSTKSLPMKKKG